MLKWTVLGNRSFYTFTAGKKLHFELCKQDIHFSKSTPHHLIFSCPHWIEWVVLHSLSACYDVTFVKKYRKSRVEKYFAGFLSWYFEEIELTLSSFAAEYCVMTNECFFRGMPVAAHGKVSGGFCRRKTANLIDSWSYFYFQTFCDRAILRF